MKANEIIVEYVAAQPATPATPAAPTLKQTAAQNRELFKRDFMNRNPTIAGAVNAVKGVGQAWKNLKGKAADKTAMAQQAGKFSDAWDQYAAQQQLPPNDLNAYKTALDDWLGKTLKVNLDRSALDRYVTSTRPGATDRYFADYFIPHYTQYQQQQQQGSAGAQQQAQPTAASTITPDIKQSFTDLANYVEQGGSITPQQRGELKNIWMSMGGTQIAESRQLRVSLYEGLTNGQVRSVKLWESAGRRLVEADLTAQQISNIFAAVQQGATASGSNRTMLGKGKDAAGAVADAWEDLKSKISSSGPIQNMDAKFDSAADKLKQATGGDAGAMKYVQKYRDFAQKHPVAQSFLYAALIAAAGLSGAGLGGAAALGLFKMTDKLLQGEKFSSAAYQGAKTGALAGAASAALGGTAHAAAADDYMPPGSAYNALERGADMPAAGASEYSGTISGMSTDDYLTHPAYQAAYQKAIDRGVNPQMAYKLGRAAVDRALVSGGALNESQVRQIFRRVERRELAEGLMDTVKQAAGQAGQWVRTKGENLTTKVTADKLQQAWKAAGSPMDSEAVAQIIRDSGVSNDIVDNVFQSLNIPLSGQSAQQAQQPASTAQTVKLDKILATIKSYIEDGGKVTPQMRGAVKDAWMRSGGTKIAERAQ